MPMWSVGRSKSGIRSPVGPAGTGGFTLLELIAVVAVTGVALSVAMPSISTGLHRWRMREAVREMNAMIKFARNQAVARRHSLQIVVDRSRNAFWLDRAAARRDAEQADEKGLRLYALPDGVRFGVVTVGRDPAIRAPVCSKWFDPRRYGPDSGCGWTRVPDCVGSGDRTGVDSTDGLLMSRRCCRKLYRPAEGAAGFTLLEVVVSLALLGLLLSAAFGVFAAGMRSSRSSTEYTRAVIEAERIVKDVQASGIRPEVRQGVTDRGFRWRAETTSDRSNADDAPAQLFHIRVSVAWQSGQAEKQVDLVTLAMAPRSQQSAVENAAAGLWQRAGEIPQGAR
jgi:prepilin-type N-terminal cleavage/methylation domain-containing protein